LAPPNLSRPPLPQTRSVSPLLRPRLLLLLRPRSLLVNRPKPPNRPLHHSHSVPALRQLLNLPRLLLHSVDRPLLLLPHSVHQQLLLRRRSLPVSRSVNHQLRPHQQVVHSVDSEPRLPNLLNLNHLLRHLSHLARKTSRTVPLLRTLSARVALPPLRLLRHSPLEQLLPLRRLRHLPIHSEVVNPLNPALSDLVQVAPLLLPHLCPIPSVPLLKLHLLLPLQRLVASDSASTPETTERPHHLALVVHLHQHPLLRLPSVSDSPTLRPPHPLVQDSHSAELVPQLLLLLLNLHSVSETPPLPQPRMEVRPLLLNLEDSDSQVQPLEVRRLQMEGSFWVWNRGIHLVVLVEGRSSLSEGVLSGSRVKGGGCKEGGGKDVGGFTVHNVLSYFTFFHIAISN